MYLIIEKSNSFHAYFEDEEHFKKAHKERADLQELSPKVLHEECDLKQLKKQFGNFCIVIPIGKPKVKAKKKEKKHVARRK